MPTPRRPRPRAPRTIETALKLGLHPRVEIGEPEQAARYIEMGVKHFCIGWDVGILNNFWRSRGATMTELLAAAPKPKKGKKAAAKPAKVAGNYA